MRHRRKKREKKLLSDLPPYFYQNKVAGWVFLNGNIPDPRDLVNMFADRILNPEHPDPEINKSKMVTLVTAAFESGHEFHDRHLILDFEQIGIDAGWRGGFPTNVRNLAVWNSFKKWKESETWLYQKYTEKQDAVLAMKRDYHSKMQGYVETVTQHLKILTQEYSELGLFEF